VRDRYQWRYLNGFVHPTTGETSWWLMPTVRIDVFSQVLAAFAQEVGAGQDKVVVVILDRAGWHTSAKVQVPPGVHLLFLPAYSPELQPAERLWPLTNEPLINRTFATLQELEEVQSERCRILVAQPQRVQALTAFHWWPCIE
jgi:DDE superfamily endonuclease